MAGSNAFRAAPAGMALSARTLHGGHAAGAGAAATDGSVDRGNPTSLG